MVDPEPGAAVLAAQQVAVRKHRQCREQRGEVQPVVALVELDAEDVRAREQEARDAGLGNLVPVRRVLDNEVQRQRRHDQVHPGQSQGGDRHGEPDRPCREGRCDDDHQERQVGVLQRERRGRVSAYGHERGVAERHLPGGARHHVERHRADRGDEDQRRHVGPALPEDRRQQEYADRPGDHQERRVRAEQLPSVAQRTRSVRTVGNTVVARRSLVH